MNREHGDEEDSSRLTGYSRTSPRVGMSQPKRRVQARAYQTMKKSGQYDDSAFDFDKKFFIHRLQKIQQELRQQKDLNVQLVNRISVLERKLNIQNTNLQKRQHRRQTLSTAQTDSHMAKRPPPIHYHRLSKHLQELKRTGRANSDSANFRLSGEYLTKAEFEKMKHQKINSDMDQFSTFKKVQSRSTSGSGAIGSSWLPIQFNRQQIGAAAIQSKLHRRNWSDGGRVISTRVNLWNGIGAPNNTPNTYNSLTKIAVQGSSKFKAGAFNKNVSRSMALQEYLQKQPVYPQARQMRPSSSVGGSGLRDSHGSRPHFTEQEKCSEQIVQESNVGLTPEASKERTLDLNDVTAFRELV